METSFSAELTEDLNQTIKLALLRSGIVNIPVLAEQIRQRNEAENIALEDIAAELLEQAKRYCAPIEFDPQGMQN